jgi:transposase
VPQYVRIRGRRICFPKFSEGIYFKGSEDRIAKIKRIKQVVIRKDAGDYYCCIYYETSEELPERKCISPDNSVGVDLGIEKFATLSDGIAIENPRFIDSVKERIKRLQKQLSRKKEKRLK